MKKLLVRVARQSPALVVAMLALFVALTGTAVATTSALIGSAQIRNNSITGLDVKNRSLRPIDFRGSVRGPRGLRGLTGATGAPGATGATGAKGDKGDTGAQGVPGPFPDGNLPPGKTIRGTFGGEFTATAGGQATVSAISFGFVLSAAPEPHVMNAGAAATPECPGTNQNPQAAAGHLCAYISTSQNLSASRCVASAEPSWSCDSASETGGNFYIPSTAAGRTYAIGTWAVTAPTATSGAQASSSTRQGGGSLP